MQLANSIIIMLFDLQRVQGSGSDSSELEGIVLEIILCTEEDKELFGKRFVPFHLLGIHGL